MAGLYDTGKPQRIIVEHQHSVELTRKPFVCPGCGEIITDYPCPHSSGSAHPKPKVTITPQFERVEERKRLK